jgi:hypothetical protein
MSPAIEFLAVKTPIGKNISCEKNPSDLRQAPRI